MQSQGSGINRDVCFTLNSTDVHAVAVIGVDLYNQCLTGGVSKTLNNRATDADHVPCVLIRGGCCAIHQNGSGEVQMSEVGYTVSTNSNASGRNTPLVLVYESHGQDARYRPLGETCETISAKYGLGGGNQPIVLQYEKSVYRKEIF